MEINYHEESLDSIIQHFAEGLKTKDKAEISKVEWFIDPVKGVVVFKVFTKAQQPHKE